MSMREISNNAPPNSSRIRREAPCWSTIQAWTWCLHRQSRRSLGRSQDKIVMRSYLLDGAFGRRLDGDYVVPAGLAAKAIRKPVKMVCTRADDMRFDCPRSATTQVLRLAWGDDNRIAAMDHHAAAGWPTATIAPYFQGKDAKGVLYDPFAIQGADHWYTVGRQRVRALRNDLADRTFRPGYL